MPCNCKTNEKLVKLGLKYGKTKNPTRKEILKGGARQFFLTILGVALIIILSPILFLYIIGKGVFGKEKTISFKKIFKLKNNVGEEQNIQAKD